MFEHSGRDGGGERFSNLVSVLIKAEANGSNGAARFSVEFGEVKVLTSPNIAYIQL